MNQQDTIGTWKDKEFRTDLSAEQQDLLPEQSVGNIELTDDELELIEGGFRNVFAWRAVTLYLIPY